MCDLWVLLVLILQCVACASKDVLWMIFRVPLSFKHAHVGLQHGATLVQTLPCKTGKRRNNRGLLHEVHTVIVLQVLSVGELWANFGFRENSAGKPPYVGEEKTYFFQPWNMPQASSSQHNDTVTVTPQLSPIKSNYASVNIVPLNCIALLDPTLSREKHNSFWIIRHHMQRLITINHMFITINLH